MKSTFTTLLIVAVGCGGAGVSSPAAPASPPADEAVSLRTAFLAKSLCSGLWVNGREREHFLANDIIFGNDGLETTDLSVDEPGRRVTATAASGGTRIAVFHPTHGCTILPPGADEVAFDTSPVEPRVADPATTPWPLGDRITPLPEARAAALAAAIEQAFDPGAGVNTRAVVVVHGGELIAERYAEGFGPDSVMISWSMGKSITAALVGTVVQRGWLAVDDPAPVAAWRAEGDPRGAITVRHLLQMSSGLAFDRIDGEGLFDRANHHFMVYFGTPDIFEYVTGFESRSAPGTVGLYRNSDPLTLGKIVRDLVEANGEDYLAYPQRALYDPVGARSMVLERDPAGNMILSGYDHGTARDWARFGLLHLRDGVAPDGSRVLPAGWRDLVSAPAPAWPAGNYAGLFWRNGDGAFPSLPEAAFWAAGAFGQHTIIDVEHDLVVVRMGYDVNGTAARAALDRAIGGVLATLGYAVRAAA